jgi:hypothetical protein
LASTRLVSPKHRAAFSRVENFAPGGIILAVVVTVKNLVVHTALLKQGTTIANDRVSHPQKVQLFEQGLVSRRYP